MDQSKSIDDYHTLLKNLLDCSANEKIAILRHLCRTDLFFLLWYGLGRKDIARPWLMDRCFEVQANPNGYLDLWAREHYKDLGVATPILTTSGWKNHGDLKVGDCVFSPNGHPVQVIATQHFKDSECYEITFCNNIKITAGAGHLWRVEVPSRKRIGGTNKRVGRETKVLTTKELSQLIKSTKYRIGIKLSNPIDSYPQILPIDPYVLGVWLSDGYSSHAAICGIDGEIFDEIEKRGYEFLPDRKVGNDRHKDYRVATVKGLQSVLRQLGLINNKHIPVNYMCAPLKERLDLLRGLIDADGNVSSTRNSTVTFTSSRYELAKQVQTLAISLGFKARLTPARTVNSYQVCFQAYADDELTPCLLPRKRALLKAGKKRHISSQVWYINSIKPQRSMPTNCIQVNAEDGMYLAGKQLIPTHNSTIITYGKTIQDILSSHGDNPIPFWNGIEPTFGLFSCTRPLAKGFMRQIKRELESNDLLKDLFPDILYKEPAKEAIKWSEDDGLIVKRRSNPKEATIEAWGLIDGQPTGKHYFARIYDDVVTIDNCRSPQMIEKTTEAWELSINLGADGGLSRYIGTRYHFNDTYKTIMERKAAIPRVYTATVDGSVNGDPVLLSREALDEKRRFMGSYTFASQMLLNPNADDTQGFKEQDLRYYDFSSSNNLNVYIVVDPANEKKKSSDYTVMCVIGLGPDHNYYLLDLIRDRLNLRERGDNLFRLHKKWNPLGIGYEQYGMMADIAYIEEKMSRENYHFSLNKLGGNLSKIDRISRLIPIFEQGRFLIPAQMHYTDYEGKTRDLINIFINQEYKAFPVSEHDDMLDSMARILDPSLETTWPRLIEQNKTQGRYQAKSRSSFSSWGI